MAVPGPLPPRRAVSRVATAAVVMVLLAACQPASDPVMSSPLAVDAGAGARAAVLARLGSGNSAATVTPAVLGRTPAAARALLADVGLSLYLVQFDERPTITVQWPAAGQPVPLDGVIEGWVGRPADDDQPTRPTAGPVAAADVPSPSPTAAVEEAAADAAAATLSTATGGVTHILPPHTAGLLRTNPRRLPALPLGTQLTGRASWYGPGFHGLQTACGGIFDRNGATIAARELRCGTVVRITGPSGLTVEATVTDWGPAEWTGRRFDLSEAVFNAIAPLGAGVIDVSVITANVPS